MRIGIDASGIFGWRGPSRNIRNIIKSLIDVDDFNSYYIFSPEEVSNFLTEKCNYKWVIVKKKGILPWLNLSLPLAMIKNKIDVALFPQANFWLVKPAKTVVMTRAAKIEEYNKGVINKIVPWLQRRNFNNVADRICAVSHFNATQINLSCGISVDKIEIVNNGVDPIFLDTKIVPNMEYGRYILFTGGTEPRKNIRRLIEAFGKIAQKEKNIKMLLVGGKYAPSEPTWDVYQKQIEDLCLHKSVILYGVEKDSRRLASLYRGSQLVVYPSLQEDFGMVSVEAMACGVALVASNAPSIPEIAGDAAEYFDPYDVNDMAGKILKVLRNSDLRRALIRKGRERVKRYDWNVSAIKLLGVIESVYKNG